MEEKAWYKLNQPEEIDSPALLIYKDRVALNIQQMIRIAGNADRLVPHVKTHKMAEIVQMQLETGIHQFKCATIAEAEMLAEAGAMTVLLSYQLNLAKVKRFISLIKKYPAIQFSSLVDNTDSVQLLHELFGKEEMMSNVFIDVDTGMHRTGIEPDDKLVDLYLKLRELSNIKFLGLHAYDGHIHDENFDHRKEQCEAGIEKINAVKQKIRDLGFPVPKIIAGGTPTFPIHAAHKEVYCSPGTCLLWDQGYESSLKEQPFEIAALLLTRVISKPVKGIVTTDLGHKSVAAENPISKRVFFLNLSGYEVRSQSEEHLVVGVTNWDNIHVGDILYGVPYHICPTVALYDEANIIESGDLIDKWSIVARRKKITI